MDRRALIAGGLCAAGALVSQKFKPHRYVSLLRSAQLDDLIPRSFGAWTSEDMGDPLALNAPGTLSAKLYNQLVTRAYSDGAGRQILMLLAHGERQTDELQLHRPEICFPAFGYALLQNEATVLRIGAGATLPARRLLARSPRDEESVTYWTRLGEYFPVSASQQRAARFDDALAGVVPDGILCRFTAPGASAGAWAEIEGFVRTLLAATGPEGRRVLIGTMRSQELTQTL